MSVLGFREDIKNFFRSRWYECNSYVNYDVFSNEYKFLFSEIEVKYFSRQWFVKFSTTLKTDGFYPSDSQIYDINKESELVKFGYDDILDELYPSFTINFYEKENFEKIFEFFLYEAEKGLKEISD